jgi:P4 family phage/plasmid primase-like protien
MIKFILIINRKIRFCFSEKLPKRMKIKISCELYDLQYDDWLESVKKTVDVVRDCLLDADMDVDAASRFSVSTYLEDGAPTIIYFPEIHNIAALKKIIKLRLTCYSNLHLLEIYLDHHHTEDSHDEHIVYFEDYPEEAWVEELSIAELAIDHPRVAYLFGEDVSVHIDFLSHSQTQYHEMKKQVSRELLEELGGIKDIRTADNGLSDYILFMMMPNIVYDTTDKVMYAYNKDKGWEEYDKNKLHFDISNTSKNLFAGYDNILSYMGSYRTRKEIVSDVHIKIMALCAIEKMDTANIIGMKNGLYHTQKMVFEEFSPKYYLNCSTNLVYEQNVKKESYKMLMDILGCIFPKESLRQFVFRWFGYSIEFGNPEKLLTIWHGASGNNGKSWLQRLYRETLGSYCYNLPVTLLTSKRGTSSAPSPEISRMENKLVVFLQEPDCYEKIHSGKAKEFTGNDSVYTRDLHKTPKNIDIWAKLVIVSNNKLETLGLDAAMKRRFLVIPFLSTFVSQREYDESKEYHFIRKDLDGLCKRLAPAFMKLLIEQHKLYRQDGLEVTDEIHDYTLNFILASNRTYKFINKYIVKAPNQGISLVSLYELFKTWHKQWYPAKSLPSMEVFLDELAKESHKIIEGSYIENVSCTYSGF